MAANLPPRPKSPPSMLTSRDRTASAQPMASRPRDDRHPPNRSDIYIPSYREGRRDDRDSRDRYRDHDRRDRYRRGWTPPPRRRDSPDRDRRPPYRGPQRRYSPRRGPYYHTSRSRSPPPFPPPRRGSRSPRRNRSMTRSHSRSPRRSPKPPRMGQYSANSPRSNSPLKRRPSRSRSRTPPKPLAQRSWVQETDSKADILDASIPPLKKQECQMSEPPVPKVEELDTSLPSSESLHTHNITSTCPENPPIDTVAVKLASPKIKSEEGRVAHNFEDEVKSELPSQTDTRAPRSPPRTSPTDEFPSWPVYRPRSPPKGPRGYGNHPRGPSNTHQHPSAPGNPQSYPQNRVPKRRQGPGSFIFNHHNKKFLSLSDGEQIEIPIKGPHPTLDEMEKTVVSTRRTAAKLTLEILQQSKHLSRQLHEFQLASMDLRAAESRRKLSDLHLEKARNGTLGIDYSEEPAESKI